MCIYRVCLAATLCTNIPLTCGSTGMKCLSTDKSASLAKGHVLHDWHAEILTIRAFNLFLLQEAHALASRKDFHSSILHRREQDEISPDTERHPFTIFEDVTIMMYCSEAPCGDASMELVMEAQENATPWPVASQQDQSSSLLGRGSFSQLGVVRRKPGKTVHSKGKIELLSGRRSC